MKRKFAALLCGLALFSMSACTAKKSEVEFYLSKRQIEHSTGDINLTVHEYDDDWRMLSVKTYLNGELSSELEYSYSEDEGTVTVESHSTVLEESVSEYRQEFDGEGRLIKAVSYNDGVLVGSTEYCYDSEGRETELVSRDPKGEIYSKLAYEYDKKGNLISYTVETSAYTMKQVHFYDKDGHIVSTEIYRNDSFESRTEYSWEDDVRHGSSYDAENKLTGTSHAVYDAFGNILLEDSFDTLGVRQLHIQYEYINTDGSVSSAIE